MSLHTREERDLLGQFLVEGEKEIALAPAIEVLYYANYTPFVQEMQKKALATVCMSEELIERVSYRGNSVIAVCLAKLASLQDIKNKTLLLACESIEKPGNLGGILRTADSGGIEGVIVADPIVDVFNPNVVRASLGALFCLPVVQTETTAALEFLEEQKLQIIVATPSATKLYYDIDFKQPTCIVIGSESRGVSPPWLQYTRVKIPMKGHVDSLNASISASILIYEALRQRNTLSR